MLEPIRQYGLRRLDEAGAVRATRDAHLTWCRQTGRLIANHLAGPMERHGVELARRELANSRAGHQHAIATAQVDAAMELVGYLHDFAIWRENYGSVNGLSRPWVCPTRRSTAWRQSCMQPLAGR
jgi:hypothetical protein